MAVPKKKISKSKRGLRKGGNGSYNITLPNVIENKTTGESQLAHRISVDGYYKGVKVIETRAEKKRRKEDEKAAKAENSDENADAAANS